MTEWTQQSGLPVGTIVTVTPSAGSSGPAAVPTPGAANSLAVAVRNLARRHANTGPLHLFLIGPLGLAVLLGHHWNRIPTTHIYEHLGGVNYVHAFIVDAQSHFTLVDEHDNGGIGYGRLAVAGVPRFIR